MGQKPTLIDWIMATIYVIVATAGSCWAALAIFDWFEHKDEPADPKPAKRHFWDRSYTDVELSEDK